MKNQFITFLQQQGEYRRYIRYAGWIYHSIFEEKPEDYIKMAFDWNLTKQGFEYWEKLNERWQRRLTRLQSLNK